MKTPSETLTAAIIPLLLQGNLLLPEDAAKHAAKLAAGSMKPEDWLLAIEKALDKERSQ